MTILFECMAMISFMMFVGNVTGTKNMYNVYWNTSNPMFRIDNTDNIIDVNVDNLAWEYDQANIICPLYRRGTRGADIETFIIYNVSKEEYESCRIIDPNTRVIAVCNKPHKFMYFTITFRSFTPTPGGLEFIPGKDYYFISTSSRSDLYQRIGGRCSSHNMKVMFKMAAKEEEEDEQEASIDYSEEKEKQDPSYWYPTHELTELESNSVDHKKRSETSHNEVIKQEALQNNSSQNIQSSLNSLWTIILLITVHLNRLIPR